MKFLKFSPKVEKKLKEIKRQNIDLYNRIQKQLSLFLNDQHHKSLRLHKIKRGDNLKVWSISINKNYRMLYKDNGTFYFFDIGTHDEVYRSN